MKYIIEDENERIQKIAEEVFKDDFDRIEACFYQFDEFKVKWERGYHWMHVRVSDYLMGAPDEVLSALFTSVLDNIVGYDRKVPECVREYLMDSSNREGVLPTYLSRHCWLELKDVTPLHNALRKLIDAPWLPENLRVLDLDNLHLVWADIDTRVVMASALMNAILVNPKGLDGEDTPEDVLMYLIFRELLWLRNGLKPDYRKEIDNHLKCMPENLRTHAIDWIGANLEHAAQVLPLVEGEKED